MKSVLKWLAGGVGAVIAIGHIGILGHLIQKDSLPQIPLPATDGNSSYTVRATRDGYEITYIGDDPKVLTEEFETDTSNGVFGVGGRSTTTRTRQFTTDGQPIPGAELDEGKLTAEQIACIEAAGGGRSSGALVGGSVATGVLAPAVVSIPYVGWLAAGWMTLLGTEVGGTVGAEVATTIKGC
jgi:hypothetical protein